ncbi:MAG TPA: NAD-dependent epimerase/dehydratase family protein [Chitinophagaceae bacterium]|jgi:nucleoside-diphosphate-sugar epimerase|nr:NAD-dependent epimerase/dehydratase family protein [Chitinophagaceae bacterium]
MVLVTGGTGFLGSYIIKELVERNYPVRAIRRSRKIPFYIPGRIFEKVQWVEGDILDPVSLEEAMINIDAVIHSAAIISFHKADKKKMYHVNVQGTANVVNAAIEKNISRLVHISSVAALGRSKSGGHINEEREWQQSNINTHYAISKYKAEMEVWRGIGEGLSAVIINPSTVLGYGDWDTSSCRIFKTVYNEFPWYSTGINGFVDIEDVARTTVLLMQSDIREQRFIANGDNWSFQQLLNTIADGFGKKHPHRRATPFVGSLAWRMEKFKTLFSGEMPLLTRESAKVAHSHTFFENDKLLKAFPQFSFTPLQESIQKTCKKYLHAIKTLSPVF